MLLLVARWSPTRIIALVAVLMALCVLVPTADAAAVKARGSINHAYVLGAKKGQRLQLLDVRGRVLDAGRADRFGSKIFRELQSRRWLPRAARGASAAVPSACCAPGPTRERSFYQADQKLKQGLNYVRMRDGVELAMTVRLPAGKTLDDGPFPTLIEYSGYQVAAPHDLLELDTRRHGRSARARLPRRRSAR